MKKYLVLSVLFSACAMQGMLGRRHRGGHHHCHTPPAQPAQQPQQRQQTAPAPAAQPVPQAPVSGKPKEQNQKESDAPKHTTRRRAFSDGPMSDQAVMRQVLMVQLEQLNEQQEQTRIMKAMSMSMEKIAQNTATSAARACGAAILLSADEE